MLGTVGTEEKMGKMSRACVEFTAQPRVTHINSRSTKKPQTDLICHRRPRLVVSSGNDHPEKKGMLKKSAEFHVHVYKMAYVDDLSQCFL